MTQPIERILIVFNQPDGSFKAAASYAENGYAVPMTQEAMEAALPGVGGLMARVADLEAQLAISTAARAQAEADIATVTAERDALRAEKEAAPAKVSGAVSPLQARKALKAAGLLTRVQAMVAASPEDDDIRLAWDWAPSWERNSPFVESLGAALGLTALQIDDLFALAATL